MARTAVTVEVLSRTGATSPAGTTADPTNDHSVDLGGYPLEEFIFRFDPIDLILDNDLPPFWDYDGETAWSSNCFESSDVFRVSVEWAKGPVEELDESDPDNYMDPTMRKMVVVGIYLEVEMVNPADPSDPILFLASGDRARFYFAPDLNHLIGGQPTWKIVEWQDIRVEGRPLLSENNSIGRIKAAFR